MEDSIFTKIIKREIPAEIVYEDDNNIAILTIAPHRPGHTLVIPKRQLDNFYDLDDVSYQALMTLVKRLAIVLQNVFQPKRVGLAVQGFEVPHAHIHLIPTMQIGDIDHTKARSANPTELKQIGDQIRSYIKEHGL